MASEVGLDSSFLTDTALTPAEEEPSESELEELLGLAFRLRPFTNPLSVGFSAAMGICSCAPASSLSSSASLSELELDVDSDDVDSDDDFIFNDLLDLSLGFFTGVTSFISTFVSLSSSLLSLPLLLVISSAMTLVAASSLALAFPFTSSFTFFAFFDFLTALVSSLPSLSLLLVSSTCDFSW